jgi:starch synthase
MPSRYEPCGLNQLYSLKYGTVPVVRAVGGLVDTVTDATPEALAAGKATGFQFEAYNASVLEATLRRAVETYWQNPAAWQQLVETGMKQDWSWTKSAQRYLEVYAQASRRHQEERERLKLPR